MGNHYAVLRHLAPHAERFVQLFHGAGYAVREIPEGQDPWYRPAKREGSGGKAQLVPYTAEKAIWHLLGEMQTMVHDRVCWRPIRHGVYPIIMDSFCRFVAADVDNHATSDPDAVRTLISTCWRVVQAGAQLGIKVHLERSAGGAGVHLWVTFTEPVRASDARRLLFRLIRKAGILENMDVQTPRGQIRTALTVKHSGGAEFDRLFPAQDSIRPDQTGNLIALPYNGPENVQAGRSVMLDLGGKGELPPDGSWPIVPLDQFLADPGRASPDDVSRVLLQLLEQGIADEPPGTRPPTILRAPRSGVRRRLGGTRDIDWEAFLDALPAGSPLAVSTRTPSYAVLATCPYCGRARVAWISMTTGWLNCWRATCDANHEHGVPPSTWTEDLAIRLPGGSRSQCHDDE